MVAHVARRTTGGPHGCGRTYLVRRSSYARRVSTRSLRLLRVLSDEAAEQEVDREASYQGACDLEGVWRLPAEGEGAVRVRVRVSGVQCRVSVALCECSGSRVQLSKYSAPASLGRRSKYSVSVSIESE
eukprot:scaffold7016_cov66-Phaeocystis_antarctica.AAC.6